MRPLLFILLLHLVIPTFAQSGYAFDSITQTQKWIQPGGRSVTIYQWRDTGRSQDRHVIEYWWTGHKREEYSERYAMKYDTLWRWDSDGKLMHVEVYSDTGYVFMDYFDDTNQVYQHGEYKFTGKAQTPVTIEDTANKITYHTKICKYECFGPCGTWYTFHRNGQMESSGSYLSIQFESEQIYQDTLREGTPCYPPGTTYLIVTGGDAQLREGKWLFYDEMGNLIREEFYEHGIRQSVIER